MGEVNTKAGRRERSIFASLVNAVVDVVGIEVAGIEVPDIDVLEIDVLESGVAVIKLRPFYIAASMKLDAYVTREKMWKVSCP